MADEPKVIKNKKLYIIQDGQIADTLIFQCPCGCKERIYLNLLPDAKPRWRYEVSKNKRVTIFPSIWRKKGCGSHFFIRNSNVIWA